MSAIDGCRLVHCAACRSITYHSRSTCFFCNGPVTVIKQPEEYTAAQHAGGAAVADAIRRVGEGAASE